MNRRVALRAMAAGVASAATYVYAVDVESSGEEVYPLVKVRIVEPGKVVKYSYGYHKNLLVEQFMVKNDGSPESEAIIYRGKIGRIYRDCGFTFDGMTAGFIRDGVSTSDQSAPFATVVIVSRRNGTPPPSQRELILAFASVDFLV